MAFCILHISDLHRDPTHELTNVALLESLLRDRDRYERETPRIERPALIIVSGDLVHGVSPDRKDAVAELDRQYEQAEEFLLRLADAFVGGNRDRVVVIPGNHDISFYHTMQAMREVKPDAAARPVTELVRLLFSPRSPFRWNWNTLGFYEIHDPDLYAARMDHFRALYSRFYVRKRTYSDKPEHQWDVFDFPDLNLAIAAFSSCYNNDPLNRQGTIHPDAIAEASATLRSDTYRGRLLLATWHHNTSGGPADSDYMNADVLQVLIDHGFSLGMHGHQHRPQFIDERFLFGGNRRITVLSASTLCAGPKALPTGHARGYNILEIDGGAFSGRLHQRRMLNEDFASPVWAPGQFVLSGTSYIDFQIQQPVLLASGAASTAGALSAAEADIRAKRYQEALTGLLTLKSNPLARPLLLECYVQLGDHRSIAHSFWPPVGTAEAIHVAEALWQCKDKPRLQQLFEMPIVKDSADPAIRHIRDKFGPRLH
jgi:3',5'-cyclic AMP phosphodiesterase CpdA